ncbi:MAG: exonuclease domain-containing protein [Roseburia sp.]|nr:exonuclease domain-containing protein [Roseburia sp.]
MNYIVLDLEWNQAAELQTRPEQELPFEIIEIGAVKLDADRRVSDTFHELIKPQIFHKMNPITGELIQLNMEQLENCRTFAEAAGDFIRWCGEDYIFCTWGNTDLLELQRNMDYYDMTHMSEKPMRYYDVQKLFSIAFEDRRSRRTLEYAVDFLRLEKDSAFHRADADARYAAEILTRIEDAGVFRNYSYDTYRLPKNKAEELHVLFDDYGKYISRAFPDKPAAMEDREVRSTKCPLCGGSTKRKIAWFSNNGRHYYCVVRCEEHGFLKGKIRLRKSADDRTYVIKTMKQIGPEGLQDILMKKKHGQEIRRERRHKSSL